MFGFAGKASAGQTSSSARRAYETMVGKDLKFKFKDLRAGAAVHRVSPRD